MQNKLSYPLELFGVVITTFAALFFVYSPFANYDLQVVAVLFIAYFFLRKQFSMSPFLYLIEALIFIFIVLMTVFETGGMSSPFFFLLYFLLFAVSLLLTGSISLILTLLLVVLFLFSSPSGSVMTFMPVFSLPFIAPFAQYLGFLKTKYTRQRELLGQIEKKKARIEKSKTYEKEQTLIFLTTALYRQIEDMNERITNFMGDADLDYLRTKIKQVQKLIHEFREYIEKI
ncbi:MAG: hypothetical protein NUV65_06100 [Candidatus Roizmanbacteria bacterium]|nr:hypothetical protein [Candidatus Roizmanbacteria bacterium]